MRSRAQLLTIALAALFVMDAPRVPSTRADIPPPPGYVEECTVEKQQKKGEYCTTCGGYVKRGGACDARFANDKLAWTQRCRTRGATVWTEVWCAPWKGKNPPKIPMPKPKPANNSEGDVLPPVF